MKKFRKLFISILSLTAITLYLSSCKDDEPVPPAKLSFAKSEITVNEADGIIEIEIVLDKPVKEDITVEYSLGGSAIDLVAAGTQYNPDYAILGEYLEVEIKKGETIGIIKIELFGDYFLEANETIEIELQDVDSDAVEITNKDDIKITIEQEGNGMIVVLDWPASGPNGQADMDLLLRTGSTISTLGSVVAGSANGGFVPGELIFIPASIGNAAFGLSYNYYEGTLDPLQFEVIFAEVVGSIIEPEANRVTYQATYTAANKNPWTNPNSTKVVQTFVMVGGVCTNFSEIDVPPSGSRMSSQDLPSVIKKDGDNSNSRSALLDFFRGEN